MIDRGRNAHNRSTIESQCLASLTSLRRTSIDTITASGCGRGGICALFAALVFLTVAGRAQGSQVWMGAMEPIWRSASGWPANDYMDLFSEHSPWTQASSRVDVWFMHKKFAGEASDKEILQVLGELKRRNIALALQGVPLVTTEVCGRAVESYAPAHTMGKIAARLKRLGADLRYVALDEPLYYGHEFPGGPNRQSCHLSIAEVAAQTVQSMAEVKAVYPRVLVGDIEPFGIPQPDRVTWTSDVKEWLQAYHQAAGVPLAFLQADLVRANPDWRAQFLDTVAILRSRRIPLGVIYNGMRSSQTDLEWTEEAERLYHVVEHEMGVLPEQAIFHSWMDRPRKMLPDTEPGTLTHLVTLYERGGQH